MEGEYLMLMNSNDVCKLLKISESTLKTKFKRTQENAEKEGYTLTKVGRGKTAMYKVVIQNDFDKAETMFKENREEVKVEQSWLGMSQIEFNLLLMLLVCPMKVYRGTYTEMSKYLEMSQRTSTFNTIKEGLEGLHKKEFVILGTDEDVVIIALKRKVEREYLNFNSELMKVSKEIAASKGIRSWISVMKVWLAVRVAVAENVERVTSDRLQELTGLSAKTIAKSLEGLAERDVLKSKKIIVVNNNANFVRCLGKKIELSGFYN